jgi:hypothetical protein
MNRRAFLASSLNTSTFGLPMGTQNVNLAQGDIWVSFDDGWQNQRKFEALFDSTQGTATLTLYDNNLNVVATSTPETAGAVLIGTATPGAAYFLKISGSSPAMSLKITESVTASSPTVMRTTSGIVPMVFTVSLSAPKSTLVSVVYATADGTALAGRDYTPKTGTLFFPPGVVSQTLTVPVLGTTMYGPSETFSLNLSNPVNVFVGAQSTGTILDNNPPPIITINNATVTDPTSGTASAVFTVSLSAASALPTTVAFTTATGTAPAGDIVPQSGTLTFAPGTISKTITVAVNPDSSLTAAETFLVKLSNPVGGILLGSQGTGNILPGVSSAALTSALALAVTAKPATFTVSGMAPATAQTSSSTTTANGTIGQSSLFASSATPSSGSLATDAALAADEDWATSGLLA